MTGSGLPAAEPLREPSPSPQPPFREHPGAAWQGAAFPIVRRSRGTGRRGSVGVSGSPPSTRRPPRCSLRRAHPPRPTTSEPCPPRERHSASAAWLITSAARSLTSKIRRVHVLQTDRNPPGPSECQYSTSAEGEELGISVPQLSHFVTPPAGGSGRSIRIHEGSRRARGQTPKRGDREQEGSDPVRAIRAWQ